MDATSIIRSWHYQLAITLALGVLATLGNPVAAAGDIDQDRAVRIKENLLYHFTHLVQWPDGSFATSTSDVTMCVLGQDRYGLLALLDERARWLSNGSGPSPTGRSYDIRKFDSVSWSEVESVEQQRLVEGLRTCHILYIAPSEYAYLDELFSTLQGTATVLVGENKDFARRGGMIAFFVKQGRLRCAVNLETVKAAELEISTRVLQHAEIVRSEK